MLERRVGKRGQVVAQGGRGTAHTDVCSRAPSGRGAMVDRVVCLVFILVIVLGGAAAISVWRFGFLKTELFSNNRVRGIVSRSIQP